MENIETIFQFFVIEECIRMYVIRFHWTVTHRKAMERQSWSIQNFIVDDQLLRKDLAQNRVKNQSKIEKND